MFGLWTDLWLRDTAIMAAMTAAALLVVLPLQLVLCFKAKKRLFRRLPTILLAAATLILYVMAITARDWSGLAYIICAVFAGVLLFFSAIAWGIWALIKYAKQKKAQ